MVRRLRAISKTDFKVGRQCATRLYYRLCKYPAASDNSPYLELLAQGGYMIGAMATLLFPEAVPVYELEHEQALARTRELMRQERITLLEPAFESRGKFARPDILIKAGTRLTLIEVKAKSCDSSAQKPFWGRGGLRSEWQPYIEDVAFQALILQECFPDCTLACELMMPDKALSTGIDALHSQFTLDDAVESGGYPRARFTFSGDVAALRRDHFLMRVNVDEEVTAVLPEVSQAAARFVASLDPLQKIQEALAFRCRDCEYRIADDAVQNGFRECWGQLADSQPHILDLYFGGTVAGIDDLIASGRTSLFDVPEMMLQTKKGELGARGQRQLCQIHNTRANREWIDPALGAQIAGWTYPLHFIDFETSGLAVPYHAGMRPFETIAFQWSCHTIETPGALPTHAEWINVRDAFPNFEFAASLKAHLGTTGTVLMWATHEQTILTQILAQLEARGGDDALKDWLAWITDRSGRRLVDMNLLASKYYFDPLMKGKTSIKKVLEAVWRSNPRLRQRFPEYVREENGVLLSPYQALPPLVIDGVDTTVQEGTAAITAYDAMVFGKQRYDESARARWRQLLLQYCRLDTAAMVMVFWHWQDRLGM